MRLLSILGGLALATSVLAGSIPSVDIANVGSPETSPNAAHVFSRQDNEDRPPCPTTPAKDGCGSIYWDGPDGTVGALPAQMCLRMPEDRIWKIYVSDCFCSFWSGTFDECAAGKGGFLGGVMMCEERVMTSFDEEPKYISCGGKMTDV